jgi:hypothetical protein
MRMAFHGSVAAFVLLLAGASTAALGQSSAPMGVRVGDSVVDGTVLKPYSNRFSQRVLRPDGTVREGIVYWTDELRATNLRGRPLLERSIITYRVADQGIISFGGALFDPRTLAPVASWETQSADDYWHMNFHGDGRVGIGLKVSPPAGSEPRFIHWKRDTPAFDTYNGTFGLLLATLPLREGFATGVDVVSEDKGARQHLDVRVLREESVSPGGSVGGQTVKGWVVETRVLGEYPPATGPASPKLVPLAHAPSVSTYWVIKQPPYLVKIVQESISEGQKTVFTWRSTTFPGWESAR